MLRRLPAACLVATLATAVAIAAPTSASATGDSCRTPVDYTQPGGGGATIDRLSVGNHEDDSPRYERVVIGLDRPAASYQVRYVPQLFTDGTGDPVELRGEADLEVRIDGADAHDDAGNSTVAARNLVRDWRSLRQAYLFGDYESVVLVGLGVSRRVDFRVSMLTGPDRLVVDLAMPGEHPWNCTSGAVQVYFFDEPRFVANTEPFFTPVWRRVRVPAVAGGALASLFHGQLPDESARGLRLVTSDAWGFANMRITDGIAHVRLTGGCDAHGSTITIAGSVIPTLKQFGNVRHVKIYDPDGTTGDPAGSTDSIPDCLNP